MTTGSKIMKRTFKYFALAVMAAAALSCAKETAPLTEDVNPNKPVEEVTNPATDGKYLLSFGATITPATKVNLNLDSSDAAAFEEGDRVLVVVGDNSAIYSYNGSKFIPAAEAIEVGESAIEFYYPVNAAGYGFALDGNAVKFTMPEAATAQDDLGDKNPLAGYVAAGDHSELSEVAFNNVGSILRVKLTGTGTLTSLTLSNGTAAIASGSEYTVSRGSDTPAISTEATGTQITVTKNVTLGDTAIDFFFLLPSSGTMDNMKVTAKMASAVTYFGTAVENFYLTRSGDLTLARNKIYTVSFNAGILFSGGTGTSEDPFIIANARDFRSIQSYTVNGYGEIAASNFLSAYYEQSADIDFANANLTPIGTASAPFTGVYDGASKTLDNFKISIDDFAGLFGVISGTAKNIVVGANAAISTTVDDKGAGAIAGKIIAGEISGCTNNATVKCTKSSGNSYVGGIVGLANNLTADVTISDCVNNGAVTCNIFAGGIAGSVNGGSFDATVFKCRNNAAITANGSNAGGIAGALYKGTVNLCYGGTATQASNYPTGGSIIKTISRAGGLVGIMNNANAWVINSSSRAFVWTTGGNNESYKSAAGGLVGYINNNGGHIVNCVHWNMNVTNTGVTTAANAKGKIAVGGIVGYNSSANGYIANCYTQRQGNALGCYKVSSTTMSAVCLANNTDGTWIGQIYGYNNGTAINCYYSTYQTGLGTNGGTDHITGVANGVKNGTEDASDVSIYNAEGSSVINTVTGKLWEILDAGKGQTGWSGSDDMSWTHYTSGTLEVAIPTVILEAGSEFYL